MFSFNPKALLAKLQGGQGGPAPTMGADGTLAPYTPFTDQDVQSPITDWSQITPDGKSAHKPLAAYGGDPDAGGWEPSTLGRIGGILQGLSKEDLTAEHAAKVSAGQDRETFRQAMADANLDPREKLALMLNREEFGKALGTNSAHQETTAGNTSGAPGFGFRVAPKLVDNNGSYGTQTASGYKQTGEATPTPLEVAKLDLESRKLTELDRYRNGQLGLGQARVAVAKAKAGKSGGGSSGPAAPKGWK